MDGRDKPDHDEVAVPDNLTTIGFDADDTLWQNEQFFRLTEDRFVALLGEHGEAAEISGKLLGLEEGKLKAIKGVRVTNSNYGMALDPEPTIIPFHKVWPRLQELKVANGGKMPRVLRNGQLIKVPQGRYEGMWRLFSVKASLTLDMARPDKVKIESSGEGQKREVSIKTLLNDGLEILPASLCGCST